MELAGKEYFKILATRAFFPGFSRNEGRFFKVQDARHIPMIFPPF